MRIVDDHTNAFFVRHRFKPARDASNSFTTIHNDAVCNTKNLRSSHCRQSVIQRKLSTHRKMHRKRVPFKVNRSHINSNIICNCSPKSCHAHFANINQKLTIFVVCVNDGVLRKRRSKQLSLGSKIVLIRAVKIEMISTQIGKHSYIKQNPIHTTHNKTMR